MSVALVENITDEMSKEELNSILDFIDDNPDYRIPYGILFGKKIVLPFGCDRLFCQVKRSWREVCFQSNDGTVISPDDEDYDLFFQQLKTDAKKAKDREVKPVDFPDDRRFNAHHIVLHLTHSDRQYEAHWHQGVDVFFLFRKDCPQQFCVGNVKVKPMADWTQETFLFVAKIAINAFLDGAATASF
jgi:hypothetical protein